MDFSFTPQQNEIRAKTLYFARDQFPQDLAQSDRDSVFDHEGWKRAADFGLLRRFVPREYGGDDWDTLTTVLALEAFGEGCRDNGLGLAISSLVWTIIPPLLALGSEEQKQHYLPKLMSGGCLAADGITEAQAGSDAMAMQTLAVRTGDNYTINGEKCCIGSAPHADLILLFAKTDMDAGPWGISAFLVDGATQGIHRSPNREKMGLRTLPTGDISFKDCVVPASARLGDEGAGMSLFNEGMEWERGFLLASQLGAMARQLDDCIEFSKRREQFGQAIAGFQNISHRIAEMRVRLETCRLLLYKAAWLKDQGESIPLEASMTKLAISEAFVASSMDAIRIHGARGYFSEHQVERNLRDATGSLIYGGTSDIQRNLISRLSGL